MQTLFRSRKRKRGNKSGRCPAGICKKGAHKITRSRGQAETNEVWEMSRDGDAYERRVWESGAVLACVRRMTIER